MGVRRQELLLQPAQIRLHRFHVQHARREGLVVLSEGHLDARGVGSASHRPALHAVRSGQARRLQRGLALDDVSWRWSFSPPPYTTFTPSVPVPFLAGDPLRRKLGLAIEATGAIHATWVPPDPGAYAKSSPMWEGRAPWTRSGRVGASRASPSP